MKKFQLYIICFFSALNLAGQTYFQFPDSNCIWSVEKEKHLVKGDSVFNSILYKKYYKTLDTNLSPASLQFVGLVRQDIPGKKIYGIAATYSVEGLMYNFNVNVNDTLQVNPLISIGSITPRRIKVTFKDSVLVNSQYRKRLTIASNVPFGPSMPETWIEGIGSSFGPLSGGLADIPAICPCFPSLLCQKVNGQTIYVNPIHNTCYKNVCSTGIKELNANDNWKISPNPNNGVFELNSVKDFKGTIEVFGVAGKIVYKSDARQHNWIDISSNAAGIYSVVLKDEKGVQLKVIKVVKG